ncbi:MAG: iron ABC transporter permease [Magnetococcales bacterium]|nr:iron ABC transporter permease [Magnetococcales bacterium]
MTHSAVSGWRWSVLAWGFSLIILIPIGVILSAWITPEWAVWRHLVDTLLGELLFHTLLLLIGVTMWVLILGVGLAWLTAMCRFPGQRFFDWALILPLAMPAYVLAFSMLGFLDYGSPLQGWLAHQFGPNGYWFPDTRSPAMVVFLFSLSLYPYVYMLARAAFLGQGQRMLEASRMLGRSPWGAFFHAALPMARPAIAAGCALAVMEALADFGAVSVLGFNTFTTAIYKAWFGLFNLTAATQLASLLLLFVAVAVTVEQQMRGRARYFSTDGHAPSRDRIRLRGLPALLATGLASLVFLLAFALPVGQLLVWAWSRLDLDLDGRFRDLALHTILLGTGAALLATLAALFLGMVRKRRAGERATRLALHLATLGYALPGSVLAVGVMLTLVWLGKGVDGVFGTATSGVSTGLSGGILALLFAYLVRFLAVAMGPVESGLERIRPSLAEAAHGLGSSSWEVMRRVYLPMLRPGLLTAILLVFVEVMKEMPATLLLRPFGWDTLAVRIYEMTSEGEWERAALPAIVLVLVGLLPVILLVRKTGRSGG